MRTVSRVRFTCVGLALGVLALGSASAGPRADKTLYVALDGDAAWSGRLPEPNAGKTDGPLPSIVEARNAIRRLRRAGPRLEHVTVLLRGGTYRLAEPFVLLPEDSNATYAAYPGERPVLSGGRVIRGWQQGRGGLWSAKLPEVAAGKWLFRQLFVNGRRRTRARSPNDGWFTIVRKAPPRIDPATGKETPQGRTAFVCRPGDIKPWPHLSDVNVVVYHSWETSRLRIASFDEKSCVVHFTGPACWPFERWGPGQRYFVENVREALDAPGEWFLDRHTGMVYYHPMPGEDMRKAEIVAPRVTRLVELKGAPELGLWVENVTLRGLAFHHEGWELEPKGHSDPQAVVTASAAIMADGALNCAFERCEIAHVGHYGIWLRRACKRNRIVQCRIHDLGVGGVRIGEAGRPTSEAVTSSHNVVDNSHIFDGGHVYPAGVGVWVAQSHHNRITHNEIHDFSYSGMSIGWNWNDAENRCHHNIIEFNHVHHVMNRQLNDGGAIYTLGTSPGSVIRNNIFHDVWPHNAIGWGIYLDATTNGYLVESNIVYNILSGGLMKHNGGHENVIRNNVFAFSAQQMLWPCWSKRPNTFERNVIYFTQGQLFIPMAERRVRERLKAGESLGVWDRNVYWNPNERDLRFFRHTFAEWQKMGLDRHSVVSDPLFVNADACDFKLKPGSPASKLGFKPIDTSKVGLYGDAAWVDEARRVKHPRTVLPKPPPPPGPKPVDDDFEATAVHAPPRGATVSGEMAGASIRVSTDVAASGRHSLKFTDSAGAKPSWQPHMFYQPHFTKGTARQSFDILLRPGCLMFTEWRDETGHPDCIGPSVRFDGKGSVTASGKLIATVPVGKWVHVEIECELRQKAKQAVYAVTLTVPDGKPQRFAGLRSTGGDFHELHWLGFVCLATTNAVFYVDNLTLQAVR